MLAIFQTSKSHAKQYTKLHVIYDEILSGLSVRIKMLLEIISNNFTTI